MANSSRSAARTQSGAFDLPSVLIGVAVVAILAIGVMATIFGVIPWAQDRAAKQDLAAIHTAQGATYAHAGGFTDKAMLVNDGWLGSGTPDALDAKADPEGKCYVAVTTSKTGHRFVISNDKPTPRELTAADTWCSGAMILKDSSPVMVTTWDTSLAPTCKSITLPITGLKGAVNWGDGVSDTKTSHTYTASGPVEIRIDGTFDSWGEYNGWADAGCLASVDRWGETGTTNLQYAFRSAINLKHVESIPSSVTDLTAAFAYATADFTIGSFDTSNVTNMTSMFDGASLFNQPVAFDTSKVTDMSSMFANAYKFNHPVPFDTSSVLNMAYMFTSAYEFNQPVAFDTSKATQMQRMFYYAYAFNQPVNFNSSNVTDMSQMFGSANSFNQPLTLNTAKVTDMYAMFYWAEAFNQPLNFDTSAVTRMGLMFYYANSFNQDLSGWNVKKVTDGASFGYGADKVLHPKFGS